MTIYSVDFSLLGRIGLLLYLASFVATQHLENTLDQDQSCNMFDRRPYDCRFFNCQFNCDQKTCHDRSESDTRACESYCFDTCGCREAGCFYDTNDNSCHDGIEVIDEKNRFIFFDNGYDCYNWWGIHFSKAGKLAKSTVKGPPMCVVQWGINFNGVNIPDTPFEGDAAVRSSDPYSTRAFQQISGVTIGDGTHGEHPASVFDTLIVGDNENKLPDRCVTYFIPLENLKKLYADSSVLHGFYDACIKTVEHVYDGPGQRRFNVRFNNKYVLHELDVYSLAGEKNKAVDVCWGFKISDDEMNMGIHGYSDWIPILNETIPLSFCYSRCYFVPDASYVVAGFYIRKG